MKKWIILGLIVIVLGAAAAYQIHIILTTTPAESIDKIQKKTGIPVSIFETVRGDFKQTISVSGSIKGIIEVSISPTITERIETIHVQTGQKVTRGELLITLNARASKLKLAYVQAAQAASEQQLLRLKNGSRPEDIEMARAQMAEAKANYDLQQIETQRQEKLYSEEATTLQVVQQTKAQFDRAEATLKSAQANYSMIKAGPRIEDIKAAEAQRTLAKVAVEQAQKNLDDHYLKAPCNGAVTRNILEEGDVAEMNKPVFQLVDLSSVYLDLNVSELHIPKITVGMRVKITLDSLPDKTFNGTVHQINPVANTTDRSYMTRIQIENRDDLIRSGMFGRAEIVINTIEQAIAIPQDAIRNDGVEDYVLIVDEANKAQRKKITAGSRFGTLQEITEGLEAGEKVITLSQTVQPGDLVKYEDVAEKSEKAPASPNPASAGTQ